MSYYLSYIEIKGHSALMLSEQASPYKPSRIICEVGFAYSPHVKGDSVGVFTKHKGHVREEQNASRIRYNSTLAKHKTYEISRKEVANLFRIINEDVKINATQVALGMENGIAVQTEVVGGPDYQYVTSNCKSYAMSVFKRLNIAESKPLNNSLIQRPHSKDSFMEDLFTVDLSCPLKDEYIERNASHLPKVINELEALNQNKTSILINEHQVDIISELMEIEKEVYSHESFFNLIEEAITFAKVIKDKSAKVGIEESYHEANEHLSALLNKISSYAEHAKIVKSPEFDRKRFKKIISNIEALEEEHSDLEDIAEHISDLTDDNGLEFFWDKVPFVSKRENLKEFRADEKLLYYIKERSNQIINQLNLILHNIKCKIYYSGNLSANATSDLIALSGLIANNIKIIHDSNELFFNQIQGKNEKEIITNINNQQKNLNNILDHLQQNISTYNPKAKEETGIFFKIATFILSFLRKDYLPEDGSLKNTLNSKLNNIRKDSMKNYYIGKNTSLLFQEKKGETVAVNDSAPTNGHTPNMERN